MTRTCPRCHHPLTALPDAGALFRCDACGARLRAAVQPATAPARPPDLQAALEELRRLQHAQREVMLGMTRLAKLLAGQGGNGRPALPETSAAAPARPWEGLDPTATLALPRPRRRRKTVLVVDDDSGAVESLAQALEGAQIPVRRVTSTSAALQRMAEERADVIVLDPGLPGVPSVKDLIETVRSTVEWIDVSILLHTREATAGPTEAYTRYGADEAVLKGPGSEKMVVGKVIQLFAPASA